MITVYDAANYFIRMQDECCEDYITNLKLQKLCYYAQGFNLAINNCRLFDNDIEAWMYGPVVRDLYNKYKSNKCQPLVADADFDGNDLPPDAQDILSQVYREYGQFAAWKLRDMTHTEPPWLIAREKSNQIISDDDMKRFFKTRISE